MRRATLWFLIFILFSVPLQATPARDPKVWYDEFNEEYFWNSLPKNTEVDLITDMGPNMGTTVCESFHFNCIIQIDESSNPIEVEKKITLLHEMCHVATWGQQKDEHGSKWQACMHRVIDAGAMDDLY